MSSDQFYKNLPASSSQTGMCNLTRHHVVPDDWTIVIVDITGSTRAVAEGRYKDVNIVSSCAIAAVLNRVGRDNICYIYGGDGATFLIPSSHRLDVASALYGTQMMVSKSYGLEMRAGMVDVAEMSAEGLAVRVDKVETHPGIFQAALSGSGAAAAEKRIKDASLNHKYAIASIFAEQDLGRSPPDFEGFECRWEPLQSRNGTNVSLLVVARLENETDNAALYQSILDKIREICGKDADWKPVSKAQLDVSLNPLSFKGEVTMRTAGKSTWDKLKYWTHITMMTWMGWCCFCLKKKAGNFDGATYQEETANNTDFMKFENALKIVMDVSVDKKDQLQTCLEELHVAKKIYYGLHLSSAAVMTCLVFSYENDHFHFVDGADGGYTMAAKQLKMQIKDDLLNE